MANILIIPARGGSKRIPEKNIRDFLGKPIIAYSVETALESGMFDEVMVSTDSPRIRDLAIRFGARVPFLRSPANADDHAGLVEVLLEVLDNYGPRFELICCLLPTAPFIRPDKISEAFRMMDKENLDGVITVQQFNYPIERALHLDGIRARMIHPENYKKRSQDLRPAYHDAGQFYLIKEQVLRSEKTLFPGNCGALVLNELEAQDIDTPLDWTLAEIKYKHFKGL